MAEETQQKEVVLYNYKLLLFCVLYMMLITVVLLTIDIVYFTLTDYKVCPLSLVI